MQKNTLIMVFPIFELKDIAYLLIPIKVPDMLVVKEKESEHKSLQSSYIISQPFSLSWFTYNIYFWGIFVSLICFILVFYHRKATENQLKHKIIAKYTHKLEQLRDLNTQLKVTKTTVYDLQSLTHYSTLKLLKYAIKYVNLYKNIPDAFQNISLPQHKKIVLKKNTLQIVDIFKDKEIDIGGVIADTLELFGSEIKRMRLSFEREYKGKGLFLSDEDLISSLLTIAMHGIVKTAIPNKTIKIQIIFKDGNLVISLVGNFSSNAKDYEYPKFVKKHFYTSKYYTTHKIIIDPLIPADTDIHKQGSKNANVISLFNS